MDKTAGILQFPSLICGIAAILAFGGPKRGISNASPIGVKWMKMVWKWKGEGGILYKNEGKCGIITLFNLAKERYCEDFS
ncbi:MAG: hypothetical protein IJ767_08925 [Bacteroidaceae bacterium]|nr:hypothetical protein [Bacteroidaceae bacterium]